MAEYKFHRRVAWELDGKAAPRGWAPDTSLKRLEEMRHDLGEERWGVLERASVEFRAAFEQTVIQNPYVKKMLGADMIALMERMSSTLPLNMFHYAGRGLIEPS